MTRLRILADHALHLAIALCCVLAWGLGSSQPAAAGGDAWKVVESSGAVRTSDGTSAWRLVRDGDVLAPGARLETGADGRLSIARGKDSIQLSPASAAQIAAGGSA